MRNNVHSLPLEYAVYSSTFLLFPTCLQMHFNAPDNKIRLPLFLRGGFSLVEIVIVLGIISFALIPLMASLAFAYQTDRAAKKSTDLALIIQTCSSLIRSVKPATLKSNLANTPITYYFADGGRYLGTTSTNAALYRCSVSLNTGVPQPQQRADTVVKIEYPSPGYAQSFSYPLRVFRYGANIP
jgi:uncharacterized protein (TIGR02598 family)